MRDGWVESTLGEVASWYSGGTPKAGTAEYYGGDIPWAVIADLTDGPVFTTAKTITPEGLTQIGGRVAPAGAILVSMYGTVGRIGVATRPMATNQAIAWGVVDESRALPEYVFAVIASKQRTLAALARGATQRNINREILRESRLILPPLDEQRRIVSVLRAIGVAVQKSKSVADRARIAVDAYLDGWVVNRNDTPSRMLGDLVVMGSGPSWRAADERPSPVDEAVPVIGIRNTPAGDELDLSSVGWVAGLPASTRRLAESSLLMIRTNGNRARIGNVYRVPPEAVGNAYSAFQIGLFPHHADDRDSIYWQLRAPCVQHGISTAASGTTGLGNVAVSWLKRLELCWPEPSERAVFTANADALLRVRLASEDEVSRLQRFYDAALASLLSGEREIPDSYDALLAEAASA